jgi:subtilisin-like proprotein convertase family protein
VDIEHREFASPGKVLAPRDASILVNNPNNPPFGWDDPRPKDIGFSDDHGTACAGVACADGNHGACGVAPKAKLMPIRLSASLGSMAEAGAFKWAADRGADVISCSWGPPDGRWFDPNDPRHQQNWPLPASTRLAMDYAVTNGRGGKGCVILFAAGNGNENVENDGYASYEKVIAVAACNDRGKRSAYSDFGDSVWCAFPSNDFAFAATNNPAPLTPGIWTTDRSGSVGYTSGAAQLGDAEGDYTNRFGGTSSACPGAAGVAALVLSANPELKWHEVKDIFRRAGDRIDPQGGQYDANGHSPFYGFGRLNARTAVELAQPQPTEAATVMRRYDAPLPDFQTVTFTLDVPDSPPAEAVTVSIDLKHTWIGDLVITLIPPPQTNVGSIVLHSRKGGSTRDLKKTYDASMIPDLAELKNKSCAGTWQLEIRDVAPRDDGTLVTFGLNLTFARPAVRSAAAGEVPSGRHN